MNHPFRYFLNVWNLYLKGVTGGFDLSCLPGTPFLSLSLTHSSDSLLPSHPLCPVSQLESCYLHFGLFRFPVFQHLWHARIYSGRMWFLPAHFLSRTEICQVFPLSLAGLLAPPPPTTTFSAPSRNFTHWCHLSSWEFFFPIFFPLLTYCFWHVLWSSYVQLLCLLCWPRNIVLEFFTRLILADRCRPSSLFTCVNASLVLQCQDFQ